MLIKAALWIWIHKDPYLRPDMDMWLLFKSRSWSRSRDGNSARNCFERLFFSFWTKMSLQPKSGTVLFVAQFISKNFVWKISFKWPLGSDLDSKLSGNPNLGQKKFGRTCWYFYGTLGLWDLPKRHIPVWVYTQIVPKSLANFLKNDLRTIFVYINIFF